jgi:hypothetical protein
MDLMLEVFFFAGHVARGGAGISPNENKLSRGERQGAWLRLNGFNHVKAGQYAGSPSAAAVG